MLTLLFSLVLSASVPNTRSEQLEHCSDQRGVLYSKSMGEYRGYDLQRLVDNEAKVVCYIMTPRFDMGVKSSSVSISCFKL
jgi:hypothetical protein